MVPLCACSCEYLRTFFHSSVTLWCQARIVMSWSTGANAHCMALYTLHALCTAHTRL